MADYNKLIENFFHKKEKTFSVDELNELIKESVLLEKDFNSNELSKYYDDWIEKIKKGEPFIIDGRPKIIHPNVLKLLSQSGKDPKEIDKIFKVGTKYIPNIETIDGEKYSLSQVSKDSFKKIHKSVGDDLSKGALPYTGTENFKEGMVCYFYGLMREESGNSLIDSVLQKFNDVTKQNNILELPAHLMEKSPQLYGQSTRANIPLAVMFLNNNQLDKKQKQLFLNAISCARAVYQLRPPSKNTVIDRGGLFNKVRETASAITGGEKDKWNPSDVYLYEKDSVSTIENVLKSAKENNAVVSVYVEEKLKSAGINELFGEMQKTIVGVSLKQEDAQHGKALGITKFASSIFPNENIQQYKIDDESKKSIKNLESGVAKVNEKTLSKWSGKLKVQKKKAFDTLKKYQIMNVTAAEKKIEEEVNPELQNKLNASAVRTIKKYECYRFLQTYLEQFEKIKKFSKAMENEKNPLLALTAYAVSIHGFNPTFYKVQGSSTGEAGHVTKFSGQERLKMGANKATIEDFDDYSGFKFKFVTEMGVDDKSNPKLYETSLNFRFKGGTQLTVEVYEFSEK